MRGGGGDARAPRVSRARDDDGDAGRRVRRARERSCPPRSVARDERAVVTSRGGGERPQGCEGAGLLAVGREGRRRRGTDDGGERAG